MFFIASIINSTSELVSQMSVKIKGTYLKKSMHC